MSYLARVRNRPRQLGSEITPPQVCQQVCRIGLPDASTNSSSASSRLPHRCTLARAQETSGVKSPLASPERAKRSLFPRSLDLAPGVGFGILAQATLMRVAES